MSNVAAVSPVALLLGDNAVQSRQASLSAGRAAAFRFQAQATGAAGGAQIYLNSSNAADLVVVGLYSSAGSHPGTLLSVGSIVAPVAGAWNSVPLSSSSIVAGSTYWLAILGEGGSLGFSDSSWGSCPSETDAQGNLGALPPAWSSGRARRSCPLAGYVTTSAAVLETPPVETPSVEKPSTKKSPTEKPSKGKRPSKGKAPTETPPVETSPPPVAPTNTALPQISGTTTEGDALSTTRGAWEGNPTSYAYQWQDCNTAGASCANIGGATSSSYTLTAADVGNTLRVIVTATNAGGKTPATSSVTANVAAIPPPPAPTNTAAPTISGTVTEGETLRTTHGTWTGSPTSYAYQWRRCSASGRSCANIGGATSSSYTLSTSDVGHALRATVTAANEGGSASMSSSATSTVSSPPAAPPANTALPTISGTATEGQTLTATTGSWEENPASYTYQWQDCNTAGASCTNISGSTSSTRKLAAADAGHTLRVIVTATNEGGSTSATSSATAVIAAAAPPPIEAPTNKTVPTISGTTTEGQTLTATTGSWEGSPTSYAYQWQDCNTAGASCTNIAGSTSSTRKLAAADAGDTIRVVVTATNEGGSTPATSKATAVIAAVESESSGTSTTNCFSNPESCGYPGPNSVGVANCSELKASAGKTITKAETIEGLDITGEVVVAASGVKLNHDCIEVNGNEEEGSAAVILNNGASNFTISNSTIRGLNTTSESIEEALRNNYSNAGATAVKDRLENCSECLHQTWTLDESYVIANGEEKADESGASHAEDWWFDNGTISANDDTLLNPSKQTAVIFAESGGGACENHETVTNSLLAGGGFMFYFCAHSTGAGSSSIDIKNNHFARRICSSKEISNYEGRGGFGCNPEGSYFSYGEGSGGYFPRGGFFGVVYEGEGIYSKGTGWEGNSWDNNLASVAAP